MALLTGSRAYGKPTERSDIDVVVLLGEDDLLRFIDLLASGVKVIPMDSSCDNFDPERGCRGHEYEKEDEE